MKNTASQRYDIIKVFTTILVVLAHTSRMYTGLGVVTPNTPSPFLKNLTEVIYSFHMPLFLCVSGMVYGLCIDNYHKYNNTLVFIANKAKRLLIPYCFFGLFYVAPTMYFLGFTDLSFFDYCLQGIILAENSRHLWFVLTLFGMFFLCGIYRLIFKKIKGTIPWFLILIIVSLMHFYSDLLPAILCLSQIAFYFVYFYIGILLNRYEEKLRKLLSFPLLWIILCVGFCFALPYDIKEVTSLCAILLFCGVTYKINGKICNAKWFVSQKKNGFGIYLFHPMIIYFLFYIWKDSTCNPVILCLLIFALSYLASFILTLLFRKLHLGVLLGEG